MQENEVEQSEHLPNLPTSFENMRYGGRVTCRVVNEGLWNGDKLTKPDRILEIMLEERERHKLRFPESTPLTFTEEEMEAALRDFEVELREVMVQLVEDDVVPSSLLDRIGFSFDEIDFAVTNKSGGNALVAEDRSKLVMGTRAISDYADSLFKLLPLRELGITNQQALRFSVITLFSHELAHQLEKKILNYSLKQANTSPQWEQAEKSRLIWKTIFQLEILTKIAQLHQEFSKKPFESNNRKIAYNLHKEKFATSFQVFALTLCFKTAGVPAEQIHSLIKAYTDQTDERRQAFAEVFTYLQKCRIPDDKIDTVTQTLETIATNNKLIGFTHFLQVHNIGYFTQYSPSELSQSLMTLDVQLEDGTFNQDVFKSTMENTMPISIRS